MSQPTGRLDALPPNPLPNNYFEDAPDFVPNPFARAPIGIVGGSPLNGIDLRIGGNAPSGVNAPVRSGIVREVPANQSHVITAETTTLLRFTMGDNSQLIISPDLSRCELSIKEFFVGNNVQIIASGGQGGNGGAGEDKDQQVNHGDNGSSGGTGGTGRNGIPLTLNLGLVTLGSLSIKTDGGTGGMGGRGGKGERGGNGERFLHTGGMAAVVAMVDEEAMAPMCL